MLEQISCSFNLGSTLDIRVSNVRGCQIQDQTHITFHEFRKVDVPYLERNWEREKFGTTFIYLRRESVIVAVLGRGHYDTLKLSSKYLFSSRNAA